MKKSARKKMNKIVLVIGVLIMAIAAFIIVSSSLGKKGSSASFESFGNISSGKTNRNFSVESSENNIYNIGYYEVNLDSNQLLIIDLSIQSEKDDYEKIRENKIFIQNAVLDAFSDYSSNGSAITPLGKNMIKKHIKDNINKSHSGTVIKQVYFNKFIVQ